MLKRKDRKAREIKGWGGGFNFQWLPQEGSYEGVTLETKISIREDHPSKDLAKTVPGGDNNCSSLFEFYFFLFLAALALHYWAWAFSLQQAGATLWLQCAGFSLHSFLSLWSTGSRALTQ